jgi:hypothetical protein
MRRRVMIALALGVGVVAIAWMFSHQPNASAQEASSIPPQSQVTTVAPSKPVGGPAITPTLPATTSGPRFTTADAASYASAHPVWRSLNANLPQVVLVSFLTAQQVSDKLGGESTGLDPDTILCYVELSGDFSFAGPQGSVISTTRAVEIFDAQSGNLLISGGLR